MSRPGNSDDGERELYEDFCIARSSPFRYANISMEKKEVRLLRILNRFTFEDFLFTEEGLKQSEEDADFRLLNERNFVIKNPEDPECEEYNILHITENLFQALRQLKPLRGVDYIWADAICIDQSNNDEKNWQVAQMYDIYKNAKLVEVRLGSGGTLTNELMDTISRVVVELTRVSRSAKGGEQGGKVSDLRLPDTFDKIAEFQALAQNPYWSRAWVRQEISSHDPDSILVCYGRRAIKFQALYFLVEAMQNTAKEMHRTEESNVSSFQDSILAVAASHEFRSMSDALDSSVAIQGRARLVHILFTWLRRIYLWGDSLQASNPRDHIYSLLSITTWREQDGDELKADYDKPSRQVYIDMARSHPKLCIWRNDPDDLRGDNMNLPSWVPDWRRRIRPVHYISLPHYDGNSEHSYRAGSMLNYEGGYEIKPSFWSDGHLCRGR